MINIDISLKGLQKISDGLYIIKGWSIHKFIITSDRYNRYLINGEMSVNYPSLLNLVQSVIIINAKYVAQHCISPDSCTASLLQCYWTVG